ncbi:hypothetical protein [Streptomyces sp. NPDC002082]|uniref:hypothetical protein n=1 Tax=Streptomyces sp. NPDC002082 TaxID=3154772 RepID=UPI00332B188A
MLRPDPAQLPRLIEIRDNLLDRIAEAEREGWLGEIEGLEVSLASAEDKILQLDTEARRTNAPTFLGIPEFIEIARRTDISGPPPRRHPPG